MSLHPDPTHDSGELPRIPNFAGQPNPGWGLPLPIARTRLTAAQLSGLSEPFTLDQARAHLPVCISEDCCRSELFRLGYWMRFDLRDGSPIAAFAKHREFAHDNVITPYRAVREAIGEPPRFGECQILQEGERYEPHSEASDWRVCGLCDRPVRVGQFVTVDADDGECHVDCARPYYIQSGNRDAYVMLGDPMQPVRNTVRGA